MAAQETDDTGAQPVQQAPQPPQPRQPRQMQQGREPQQQGRQPQQQGRQPQQPRSREADGQNQQRWPDLSVVIPLYNEEGSLKELHQQLRATLGRMGSRYEIIFIDDGSTDRSFRCSVT